MTTFQIPNDLAENIAKGSCVLFLGADADLGADGPPTRAQLAAALAAQYGLPPRESLAEAASAFLCQYPRNRHGLIDFIKGPLDRRAAHDLGSHGYRGVGL